MDPGGATDQVVAAPATDRVALADPTTAALLELVARTARLITSACVLAPLLGLGFGIYVWLGSPFEPKFLTLTAVLLLFLAALIVSATGLYALVGRSLPSLRRLLSTQAWRPIPATVYAKFVALADGTWLRVRGQPDVIYEVIARTGRVWVVGPDPAGWYGLRVDGTHGALPARRAAARTGLPARRPAPPGITGTAADDPVATAWAATAVRLILTRLTTPVFLIVFVPLLSIGVGTAFGTVTLGVVLGLAGGLLCVLGGVAQFRRTRTWRALPALLRAGPWTRVNVTLQPWAARPDGAADADGTVFLGNGGMLGIRLPEASIDLLSTIWETGTVWLAGEPAAGRTLAAGFPGYPLLGVATLS